VWIFASIPWRSRSKNSAVDKIQSVLPSLMFGTFQNVRPKLLYHLTLTPKQMLLNDHLTGF